MGSAARLTAYWLLPGQSNLDPRKSVHHVLVHPVDFGRQVVQVVGQYFLGGIDEPERHLVAHESSDHYHPESDSNGAGLG